MGWRLGEKKAPARLDTACLAWAVAAVAGDVAAAARSAGPCCRRSAVAHRGYTDLECGPTLPPAEAVRRAKRARKKAILADAGQVYSTDVTTTIRHRAEVFRATWNQREPQAVGNFFVDFPQVFVSLIRTTNLLERFHKEVRRKQRDIGMFQSERGCEVVWCLIATRETAKQHAALVLRR